MPDITHLSQLAADGHYTYADYLSWKFQETVELIKGKMLQMSAPSRRHQQVSWQLSVLIGNHFSDAACFAYAAPFDVRLPSPTAKPANDENIYTVIQPDLCIICDANKLDDKGCLGAPDLIIEILSPGNSAKEMRTKKNLYEESGVREYWIVDPERETVHQFYLSEANTYEPARIYVSEELLPCIIFPEMSINLAAVFRDPLKKS